MQHRQGPTQRAKITSDRQIFETHANSTIPTTKVARTDAPVTVPALACPPGTPHAQPAPPTALSKLSCE